MREVLTAEVQHAEVLTRTEVLTPLPAEARGTRALSDDRSTARNVVLGKSEEADKQHRI